MSRSSKAAGARFEKWVTDFFNKKGWASARLRSFRVQGEPDLYAAKGGVVFDIQAKERQQINISKVLVDLVQAQHEIASRQGLDAPVATPLVVYKRVEKRGQTGKRMQVGPVMAILPLEDLVKLLSNE